MQQLISIAIALAQSSFRRGEARLALSKNGATYDVCVVLRTGEACLAPTRVLMLGELLS
jgi:hypothetical protein